MDTLTITGCIYESEQGRFAPPLAARAEIERLDRGQKQLLDLWLRVMGSVHGARARQSACLALAAQLGGSGLKGFSAPNIDRVYRGFRASGWRWQYLVPDYHLPDTEETVRGALPLEFRRWWQRFAGEYAGGTAAAHAELVHRWRAGAEIEGLGSWMSWWQAQHPGLPLPALAPELPEGCSYTNLLGMVPSGAELTVVREGYFAAQGELPMLRRDRSELRALELLAFDDKQLDWRVAVPGRGQVCKFLGLFGMDVGSGCIVQHGAGARVANDDQVQRALTRADGRATVYQLLRRYGVPKRYAMHLLFENASFAIDQHDADLLGKLSPRLVVDRTPMRHGQLLPGGPRETFGSPQAKGWLESWFNLLDRACSALPGQAGRNPLDNKRGDIDDLERETLAVVKLTRGLPDTITQLVQLPLLTEAQGKVVLGEIVARLNHRTEHRLQGFAPVPKWRLRGLPPEGNPWRPVEQMPADLPDSAIEIEHFRESPAERFLRLYRPEDFEPIPEAALLFLLDEKRTVRVVRPYQLELTIDKVLHMYTLRDPRLEQAGAQFIGCYDRSDRESLHLLSLDGAYVGTAALWHGPSPVDRAGIATAAGVQQAQRRHLLKRAAELHAPRAVERLAELTRSNERLAGAVAELETARVQLTEAERMGAERLAAAERSHTTKRRITKRQQADTAALAHLAAQTAQNFSQP